MAAPDHLAVFILGLDANSLIVRFVPERVLMKGHVDKVALHFIAHSIGRMDFETSGTWCFYEDLCA